MTILEALAILEAVVSECKKREVNTPELRAALDFLEPHIQPSWLIPQFRHNLDGEQEHDYGAREGQQQVFRATFPGIRDWPTTTTDPAGENSLHQTMTILQAHANDPKQKCDRKSNIILWEIRSFVTLTR